NDIRAETPFIATIQKICNFIAERNSKESEKSVIPFFNPQPLTISERTINTALSDIAGNNTELILSSETSVTTLENVANQLKTVNETLFSRDAALPPRGLSLSQQREGTQQS
ncbi:MAG TPA: hypothetical protein VHZ76_09975, partial [Gammaproteobacteria bacterium]|nr:hypothetical protein [Gammaproteobacteria bacterium]